jgi:hypothetical protein
MAKEHRHTHRAEGELKSGFKFTLGVITAIGFAIVSVIGIMLVSCISVGNHVRNQVVNNFKERAEAQRQQKQAEDLQRVEIVDAAKPVAIMLAKNTIKVIVESATVAKLKLKNRYDKLAYTSTDEYLLVKFTIHNENKNLKLDHMTWANQLGVDPASDEHGNKYFASWHGDLEGFEKYQTLHGGEKGADAVVFEKPISTANLIKFDLPIQGDTIRLAIHRTFWDPKSSPKSEPLAQATSPKPESKPQPKAAPKFKTVAVELAVGVEAKVRTGAADSVTRGFATKELVQRWERAMALKNESEMLAIASEPGDPITIVSDKETVTVTEASGNHMQVKRKDGSVVWVNEDVLDAGTKQVPE